MAKARSGPDPRSSDKLVRLEALVAPDERRFLEDLGRAEFYGNRNAALRSIIREAILRSAEKHLGGYLRENG